MGDPDFDGRSTRRREREWVTGPFNQDHEPPKMVKEWKKMKNKKGELTKPIDFDWEASQAKRIIASLETCTQEWVKDAVKKRRALDKQDSTDSAQAIFAADRHGKLNELGVLLRNMRSTGEDADNTGLTDRQAARIDTWIASQSATYEFVTAESKTVLTLHCSITAEELIVLSELHRTYDRALCHFMRHILSPNFARFVNALRLKADSNGDVFGWIEYEKAVLEQLKDTAEPNDVMDFQLGCRDHGVPCYIWVAERASERQLLESDGVKYPEQTWLAFVLHMLTNEERHILSVPPDNMLNNYTMAALSTVAANSDPKSFKPFKHQLITSTLGKRILRIRRLLDADDTKGGGGTKDAKDPKNPKEKNGKNGNSGGQNAKDKSDKAAKPMSAQQLRNLELVSALPQKDGKPDKGVYDLLQEGKTRQRIWQRIEDKACIRCGSSDHLRANCPQSEKIGKRTLTKEGSSGRNLS